MPSRAHTSAARLRDSIRGLGPATMLAVALGLVACGGGGYGGMNPLSSQPPPTVAVKSAVTVGTISSFGSSAMTVDGTQFQTNAATVTVDGKSGQPADLRAGEMVRVKSHHDDAGNKEVADQIDFRGDVEGPVSVIDSVAQILVVVGQTVRVSASTSFDTDIGPASLAGVHVGDVLEVSGMVAADGSIQATRIERKDTGSASQVIGTAAATDMAAMTLQLNELVVDFSAATLKNFPSTGPKNGDLVEATGSVLEANGALRATTLELLSAGQGITAEDNLRIEGLVTRFVSATDFDVGAHAVSTSAATQFQGGTVGDLALNLSVEVEGIIDATGVLEASQVRIEQPADVRVIAQVDSVDSTAATVRVLGNEVVATATTRFEDHGSGGSGTFRLGDARLGDWVEVRGVSPDGARVIASRIDRLPPQSEVRLGGPVTASASPEFTLVSTPVATNAATQFSGAEDSTTFFDSLVGKVATVRGAWDGSVLSATQVQLGGQDDGGDE